MASPFKFFGKFFGKLLHVFALIFKGRTGQAVATFGPLAAQMIQDLLKQEKPVLEIKELAFTRLKAAAAAAGLAAADHALNYLIAQEITKAQGDKLEKILDGGLEEARRIVLAVEQQIKNSPDTFKFKTAWETLKSELLSRGKAKLTSDSALFYLIEAAVSSLKF